jgi:uncharacterized metal-binding protein
MQRQSPRLHLHNARKRRASWLRLLFPGMLHNPHHATLRRHLAHTLVVDTTRDLSTVQSIAAVTTVMVVAVGLPLA